MEHRGYGVRSNAPIFHVEKERGVWQIKTIDRPSARYHVTESSSDKPVGHRLSVQEHVVIDTQTNVVIARSTTYKRVANTVDQAWMGLIGSTLSLCPDPSKGPPRASLVDQTIAPIK